MNDTKVIASYNDDGWILTHPDMHVWILVSCKHAPDGMVTVSYLPTDKAFEATVTQLNVVKTNRVNGVRTGMIWGMQRLYVQHHRFLNVNKLEAVLDAAGLHDDMQDVLSRNTHHRLQSIIQRLTEAAHDSGIKGLIRALKELSEEA